MGGKTFLFSLGSPVEGVTDAVYAVRVEESDSGGGLWTEIQTTSVTDMIDDGGGRLRLEAPSANSRAYHRLVPITAAGVERSANVILPPLPADPDSITVYCWALDCGLRPEEGVSFSAIPKKGHAAAGERIISKVANTSTDEGGYAVLTIPANAGIVRLAMGDISVDLDTTGRAGQAVNLASLL